MPNTERTGAVVFGAILGVLVTLGTLLGVVNAIDARYVSQAEYRATLVRIDGQLADIKAAIGRPAPAVTR